MAKKPKYQKKSTDTMMALDASSFVGGGAQDSVSAGLARMAVNNSMSALDSAFSPSNAFLISELEKRDPTVRTPLTTFTWADNIPVSVGGGWVDKASIMNIQLGSAGASDDSSVSTGGADVMPTIQGVFGKDIYGTHVFLQPLIINEIDMKRQNITGRSLQSLLSDGVRLNYDKYMDKNVFIGLKGSTGLLNNPNVQISTVPSGSQSTSPTTWAQKLKDTNGADEILTDVNNALSYSWETAGRDRMAVPNHVLLPYDQYILLSTNKVSEYADKTILEFILANNIASKFGSNLTFGVSLWGKGIGTGGTDRMAVYRHDERFLRVEELEPLSLLRAGYDLSQAAYVANYAANVSEVEMPYGGAGISYWDGI